MEQIEQRRSQRQYQSRAGQSGQAGFTLIEVMLVIFVMGILAAAVSVNWTSFIRHQELRQDAINLHKEIMALKARAIEYNDTAVIFFAKSNANEYTIKWRVARDNEDNGMDDHFKTITLNNGVTIASAAKNAPAETGLLAITNNWIGSADKDTVMVEAKNLEAFKDGRILITSAKTNDRYCIQKDAVTSIRPELYHQSQSGATWTRM